MPEQGPDRTQPMPTAVDVPQQGGDSHKWGWRRITAIAAIAGTGLIGGYAAFEGGDDEANANDIAAQVARGTVADGRVGEAQAVTNEDLRALDLSDYNCGGHLQPLTGEGRYGVDYAFDYFNQHPELGKEMRQFHIDTLGKGAWDSLLKNGKNNSNTHTEKAFKDTSAEGKEMNQWLHMRNVAMIKEDRTYANFTCTINGEVDIQRAPAKPVITIKAGNHVEGIVVDQAGHDDFIAKVKKNADGQVPVDIVNVGVREVTYGKDDVRKEQLYLIALQADGCDNPILRLTTPPEKKETPTTTTTPKVTTTTGPSSTTTSTTQPTTTTTTRPRPKRDDGVLPGDGTPAAQDPGTPDVPGEGPAEQPPADDGYVDGELPPATPTTQPAPEQTQPTPTTAPRPTATTSPQPVTTNPPVPATTVVPQPPVQTGPRPTKP